MSASLRRLFLWMEASRISQRKSQQKLADEAGGGLTQFRVSSIERGLTQPTPDQEKRLTRALGLPDDLLLKEVEMPSAAVPADPDAEKTAADVDLTAAR